MSEWYFKLSLYDPISKYTFCVGPLCELEDSIHFQHTFSEIGGRTIHQGLRGHTAVIDAP